MDVLSRPFSHLGHCHLDKSLGWKTTEINTGTIYCKHNAECICSTLSNVDVDTFEFIKETKLISNSGSYIIETDANVYASIDSFQTNTVSYIHSQGYFRISNNAVFLSKLSNYRQTNILGTLEFLTAGHTVGNSTLLESLFTLNPGQYLVYCKATNKLNVASYHEYPLLFKADNSYSSSSGDTLDLLSAGLHETLEANKDRQLVIPLRGTVSEALLLSIIKQINISNVVSATLDVFRGKGSNYLTKYAKCLGIPTLCFRTSRKSLRRHYFTQDRKLAFEFASGLNANPDYIDYELVKCLRDDKSIVDDALILDASYTSLLPGNTTVTTDTIFGHEPNDSLTQFVEKYFSLWPHLTPIFLELVKHRGTEYLSRDFLQQFEHLDAAFRFWEWRETLPKTQGATNRFYEYFHFQYLRPFDSCKVPIDFQTPRVDPLSLIHSFDSTGCDKSILSELSRLNPSQPLVSNRGHSFPYVEPSRRNNIIHDYFSYFMPSKKQLSQYGWKYYLLNYRKVQDRQACAFSGRFLLDELDILGFPQEHLPAIITDNFS